MKDFAAEIPNEVTLRIIGYREGGEWVALALEMDLRGYGETFEEARADLHGLVSMQIGFARFKELPEMIWKSAEPVWFARWEEGNRERLRALILQQTFSDPDLQLSDLRIPPAHVIEALSSNFQRASA